MNTSSLAGKVIRAPSLKRGKNGEASLGEKVKLERVLGLTVSSNAALDCDPDTELVVYPAGCTVVLFNPIKNRQSHLLNSSRKTITCLALSPDGHYLVTGECGHLPLVRVWDLHEEGSPGVQVAELPSHKYGINCVAFSPSNKYVVSVGSQHDMIVNVWDWKTNLKVASNKVSTKVKAVSFAENGSYFVTVGNRHVKFWYLEYSRSSKIKEAVPLMGRSAILGEQRNNYFCDVACGHGKTGDSTYAITKSGLLCEFNNRRLLDKWVELRTTSANCIALGENFIFIGCAEGIVRCFTPSTLQFVTTLPRTHYLGVDVAQGLSISHMAVHPMNAKYPDAIALAYDPQNCKLTCIYNDHSMYIWDVRDIKRVGKSYSFLFHSACIWGVDMYPVLEDNTTSAMPHGCFITCSSDDTIRVWNLDPSLPLLNETLYKRNIYSTDLMKVLYVDPDLTYLKDLDTSVAGTADKNDSSYDSRNGVRSLRISPDGKHLASGDRAGNIRIHHLITLQELCRIEAHDAEVLCLEYSRPESGHRLLASASRDRLIHIFNVDEEYNFVQTLDDHSSSITAVKFLHSAQQLQMVSCGADKSIIFRQLQSTPGGSQIQFSRGHNVAGKTTLYDMEVDSGQKHILTACQDRSIRVYNVNTGKHSKSFKGSISEDGSLIKVVLDNSGIYAATSCTDKTLCIYDYYSGECMATMYGHSELVTGLKFTNDCRKLISASGDGCIFVWKVPHDMVVTMHARLSQQAARLGKKLLQSSSISLEKEYLVDPPPELLDPNSTPNDPANYRFTLTQLPFWAKKQMSEHTSPPLSLSNKQRDLPRGRWAQRLDTGEIKVKSVYDSDSVIQISGNQEKKHDSDGSKDSSIDSGTELRNYMEVRQEGITSKQSVREITELPRNRHFTDDSSIGSYKYEDIESTEHDGDVEDYSEGEGESTEPEQVHFPQVYYPPAEETGSDYTVNAMDVEELRRSQRRCRKNQRPEKLTELPLISVSASVSGSQDSEDDDEDASTPSAETGERNLLSMLSISTESLDFVGKREKFLKNTFESLSGTEVDADRNNDTGGTSISSQFLVRTSQNINYLTTPAARNVAVINATKQTRSDNETSSKREELQRRIEETRRKLQSVGYQSNLKTSQSISDLSRIPEKDFRNHHGVNLAHRYTTSGGKKYAALIRHKMNYNTNPTLFFNTIVNINNLSSLKCKNHIALGTKNNIVYVYASKNQPKIETCLFLKSQTTNLSARKLSGQSTNQPKKLKLSSGLLHRTDTYVSKVLPLLHFTSKHIPELILNTPKGTFSYFLKYKNTGKFQHYDSRINNSKPLTINISKHTNLFTKPLIKEQCIISSPTVCNVLHSVSVASSSVNVSMTAPLENTPFKIIGESSCVEGSLEDSVLNSSISSSSNTNETNFNEIQCVYLQHDLSTKKRTRVINLLSNTNSCTNFIKSHNSNLSITNQSLPESPVYENLCSSSKHFKNITKSESKANCTHSGQQNRSCSYFINLNENINTEEINSTTCINKSIKSSESLPINLIETNYSSKENLLNSCGDEDNMFDNFSSDSLEEPTEFVAQTPRRCTSDYQLSSYDLDTSEYVWRSASATDSHTERKKKAFHSQENLLSIKNSRLEYQNKDILEFYPNYEQDRHSSASFFLSLNNIQRTPCLSQDSILTTENEYHLSSCHQNESKLYMDKNKDSCKSTESFLESDCYSSSQHGDFHEIGGHQDSCQSTESILTDDSDYQVFKSPKKAVNHLEEKYKMSKKTKPLTSQQYNKVLKGNPIINNTCITPNKLFSIVGHNFHTDEKIPGINKTNSQTVYQTQSLQDASVSLSSLKSHEINTPQYSIISSPSTRHPTCNKIINNNDSIETDIINSALLRKKSYPISRPLTATSLQIHSQFAVLDSSNLKELDYGNHDLRNKNSQRNNKPPTAPKPISDKPPLKPQQKQIISPPMNKKSHTIYNVDLLTGMQKVSNQESFYSNYDKNTYLSKSKETTRIFLAKNTKKLPFIVREASNSSFPYQHDIFKGGKLTIKNATKHECKLSKSVKLLCKSFENALEDYEPSDDCIADLEEDCFPVLGGSSSSTPATSSSAANSPKRLWPPASRAPVQRHLPKRMSSSHQPVLPNKKCSSVSGRMVSKSTSNTRTLSRHGTKQAASVNSVNIKRSTSMGVLNQSDSESDISLTQRPTASLRVTGIMRPTISSQNKITVNQNKLNTSAVINRRRGISSAYSSVNLSQVGSNEDSSSEETSPGGGKPAHSIRPRSTSADRLILGASSSLSTTVIQPQPPPRYSRDPIRFVTQRLAASKSKPTPAARHGQLESGHQEFPCKDSDILFKPLSLHLCTSVADQLTRTAENVVQLRKRISTEGDTVSELQKHNMVKALEEAINEAQHTLQLVAMPTNTSDQSTDPTLAIKLQELYSMVQQRMNQSSL